MQRFNWRYKWGGKEGDRYFSRIYSSHDFIPRNAHPYPTVNLRAIQRKGCAPPGKREHRRRETAGFFRETGRIPSCEPGKGWLQVRKRVHPGTERGSAAGTAREIFGSAPYSVLA